MSSEAADLGDAGILEAGPAAADSAGLEATGARTDHAAAILSGGDVRTAVGGLDLDGGEPNDRVTVELELAFHGSSSFP